MTRALARLRAGLLAAVEGGLPLMFVTCSRNMAAI